MEYITTKEASAKWGISTSRITLLANEGRIPGAQRLGKSWLIPVSAAKPPVLKANHSHSAKKKTNNFSFPLYHFRPDWRYIKESQLSGQQQNLLLAESAVLECRFADAYPILESILSAPDDIFTEIGCLWNMGICCLSLNKPKEFSRIFLRLQIRLSEEFPHRDDLVIILDTLKTYIETMRSAANGSTCSPSIHDQCLPLMCTQIGYEQLSREAMKPNAADTALLELNLRLLETTGVTIAVEIMHCHLLGIYYLRQNIEETERHAKAIVQIAFENKFYFPLVSYFSFFSSTLSPILSQYPEEFQDHCHTLISQYNINYTAFLSSKDEYENTSKITEEDQPYIMGVLMGLTYLRIAEKLGVSESTVNRRLAKIRKKLGIKTKKGLLEYLHNYM